MPETRTPCYWSQHGNPYHNPWFPYQFWKRPKDPFINQRGPVKMVAQKIQADDAMLINNYLVYYSIAVLRVSVQSMKTGVPGPGNSLRAVPNNRGLVSDAYAREFSSGKSARDIRLLNKFPS